MKFDGEKLRVWSECLRGVNKFSDLSPLVKLLNNGIADQMDAACIAATWEPYYEKLRKAAEVRAPQVSPEMASAPRSRKVLVSDLLHAACASTGSLSRLLAQASDELANMTEAASKHGRWARNLAGVVERHSETKPGLESEWYVGLRDSLLRLAESSDNARRANP